MYVWAVLFFEHKQNSHFFDSTQSINYNLEKHDNENYKTAYTCSFVCCMWR